MQVSDEMARGRQGYDEGWADESRGVSTTDDDHLGRLGAADEHVA